MKYAVNGVLVLNPYKKSKQLEVQESIKGFASVANKTGMESLELLVDTFVSLGHNSMRTIPKGSKIFFKREILDVMPWSKVIYQTEEFPDGFIVGNMNEVIFIEEFE